jgi:SAM-dependent methyltransferase
MSWDPNWEKVFSSRRWGRYPPEELVRFVARNFASVPDRTRVRILEVGCGPGANLWFMAREGYRVFGVDGSQTAINQAQERLNEDGLRGAFVVGDGINLRDHFPANYFDAVIDVACLQHNDIGSVRLMMASTWQILKPGGRMFSMMVDSESHGFGSGSLIEPGTFAEVDAGPCTGTGLCHFFSLEEVQNMFSIFAEICIERSRRSTDNMTRWYGHWVVEAVKQHEVAST